MVGRLMQAATHCRSRTAVDRQWISLTGSCSAGYNTLQWTSRNMPAEPAYATAVTESDAPSAANSFPVLWLFFLPSLPSIFGTRPLLTRRQRRSLPQKLGHPLHIPFLASPPRVSPSCISLGSRRQRKAILCRDAYPDYFSRQARGGLCLASLETTTA